MTSCSGGDPDAEIPPKSDDARPGPAYCTDIMTDCTSFVNEYNCAYVLGDVVDVVVVAVA